MMKTAHSKWREVSKPPKHNRIVQIRLSKEPHSGRVVVGYYNRSHWALMYNTKWIFEVDGILDGKVVQWREICTE